MREERGNTERLLEELHSEQSEILRMLEVLRRKREETKRLYEAEEQKQRELLQKQEAEGALVPGQKLKLCEEVRSDSFKEGAERKMEVWYNETFKLLEITKCYKINHYHFSKHVPCLTFVPRTTQGFTFF